MQQTIEAFRSLMVPAQLDRHCSGCWLYVDAMDSRRLCYMEEWTGLVQLGREIRSTRFTRLLSIMEDAPKRPSLEFRFIDQIRGLDYVREVRLANTQEIASRNW